MIHLKDSDVHIIENDFLLTQEIKDNLIDLVITSPPYNLGIKYDTIDDAIDYNTYLSWSEKWISKCYRLLKTDGRLAINVPFDITLGGRNTVFVDITNVARSVGFKHRNTIIWYKQNIISRTAWGSYMSATSPNITLPCEAIIIFYKTQWRKRQNGISDITAEEFIDWTMGVWSFAGENKYKVSGHPAAFPIELPRRCIKLFSYVGDTVLDPFLGSGTTGVAAWQNDRKCVGVEISPQYCEIARKRIQNAVKMKPLVQINELAEQEGKQKAMCMPLLF